MISSRADKIGLFRFDQSNEIENAPSEPVLNPVMSGLRIHRLRGPREGRIGEAADGHRDHIRFALLLPEYCRAADLAKMKPHRKSALGWTLIGGAGPLHQNVRAVEEGRYSERGTGSSLTGETMAERDQLRLR